MRRVQLIELHDQAWFPAALRDDVTDTLQFGLDLLKTYSSIAPLLQGALDATHSRSVIDLCSGAGGPWLDLSGKVGGTAQIPLQIVLTDKYPNLNAFQLARSASGNRVDFCPQPVDARNVPPDLKGFRTLFTSFHHFPPDEARAILQNAVDAGQGICIFEATRRAPSTMGLMFVWIFALVVLTPWIRPFRWSRLLCTYVVPILPLVLLFDGVVSCLRTYAPLELRELIASLDADDYHWEVGMHSTLIGNAPVTYLIGYHRPSLPIG